VSVEHLWAGWRRAYVVGEKSDDGRAKVEVSPDQTLFEALLHSGYPDDETFIVWRGETAFAILNAYPYTSGHLMVLPQRAVKDLTELNDIEFSELWQGVRMATQAVKTAYQPHGVNVGANMGEGSGAGIPDHLHVHVVPRWAGDTNFMTAAANTRVMPEALCDSWLRLREAWPA